MKLTSVARNLRTRLRARSPQSKLNEDLQTYQANGRRPWSRGYLPFRDRLITGIISDPSSLELFARGTRLPPKYGEFLDERVVEYPWILSRIPSPSNRILDAGSALNFEHLLGHASLAQKDVSVFTLEPEPNCFWNKRISYVYGDLRAMPWRDNWFDVVLCISTLEHVGMDNGIYSAEQLYRENKSADYLVAVRELKRVVKEGGRVFISVPFGRYTNFGWYQQFDAERIRGVIDAFEPRSHRETYFRYHDGGWQFSTSEECGDARGFNIHDTKYFNPASDKDYDPDYAACSRAIAALELCK